MKQTLLEFYEQSPEDNNADMLMKCDNFFEISYQNINDLHLVNLSGFGWWLNMVDVFDTSFMKKYLKVKNAGMLINCDDFFEIRYQNISDLIR